MRQFEIHMQLRETVFPCKYSKPFQNGEYNIIEWICPIEIISEIHLQLKETEFHANTLKSFNISSRSSCYECLTWIKLPGTRHKKTSLWKYLPFAKSSQPNKGSAQDQDSSQPQPPNARAPAWRDQLELMRIIPCIGFKSQQTCRVDRTSTRIELIARIHALHTEAFPYNIAPKVLVWSMPPPKLQRGSIPPVS